MTREEVIAAIRECAQQLGRNPTFSELKQSSPVRVHDIRVHFGSLSQAKLETGLAPKGPGYRIESSALFRDWAELARKMGKAPSMADYSMHGLYSLSPMLRRFGNWGQVPAAMRRYAEENGLAEEWADVLEMVRQHQQELAPIKTTETPRSRLIKGRPVYGPPIAPAGLAHEPVNEVGVVYLFGMLAGRLGYVVTHLQAEFPDCEALREVEIGRWQRVKIEFEFESRNFVSHGHDSDECDVIVCWTDTWPGCPLEVLELSKVVGRSPTSP
jgi:hypothetical protein